MKSKHITSALAAVVGLTAPLLSGETLIFPMPESAEGNAYRLRADDLLTTVVPLPAKVGTTGYPGDDGRIWMSFVRFGINEPMLLGGRDLAVPFDALANASRIVFRTAVVEKAISRQESDEGGVFIDIFFIPDHATFPGFDLDPLANNFTVWDAPRHPNSIFVREFDPTQYSVAPDRAAATLDQFNLEIDLTAAVRTAITEGVLTASSRTFSIAFFPNEVEYWANGAYQPTAPGFAPHRISAFKFSSLEDGGDPPQLEITLGGEDPLWYGFEVNASGWAYTGDWLGWVHVSNDPWIYVLDLNGFAYLPDDSGWAFIPR